MKKSIFLAAFTAIMILSLIGCGKKEEAVGMANPMVESDYDSIVKMTGASFTLPVEAQDVQYFIIGNEVGEVQYSIDDKSTSFTIRAAKASEFTDISGMYYDWPVVFDGRLGDCKEKDMAYSGDDGDAQLCMWFDSEKGIMYSLSATGAELNGLDIVGVAMEISGLQYSPALN